jgi:hypothetical protein
MSSSFYTNRQAGSRRFTKPKLPAEYNLPLFIETLRALLIQMVIQKTQWECRDVIDEHAPSMIKSPFYKTQAKSCQNTWVNSSGMNRPGPQGMFIDIFSNELIEHIINVTLAWRSEKHHIDDPDRRKEIKTNAGLVLFLEKLVITPRDVKNLPKSHKHKPNIIEIPLASSQSSIFYSIYLQTRLSAKIP